MSRQSKRQWGKNRSLVLAVIVPILVLGGLALHTFKPVRQTGLKIFVEERPGSFDPVHFDFFHLKPYQSIANAKLFSNYQDARLKPELVKSWKYSNSGSDWQFVLRDDVSFFRGRKLTAEDVVRSLQRAAYLSAKAGSKNGFVENLKGIEKLTKAFDSNFPGISLTDGQVKISLTKPVENLPETLTSGLYAVVNPKYFDAITGEWRHFGGLYEGSGPYSLNSHEGNRVIFSLRNEYPGDLFAKDAFKSVEFLFEEANKFEADLFLGDASTEGVPKTFAFKNGGSGGIAYFLIHPWKLSSSPLSKTKLRCKVGSRFREFLSKALFDAPRSFFPLILSGVGPVALNDQSEVSEESSGEISLLDFRPMSTRLGNAAINSMELAIKSLGFSVRSVRSTTNEKARKNKNYDRKSFDFDIGYYVTDISVIDPKQDVRLMFSQEGIRLPDVNGVIAKELKSDNFSIQKINEQLLNQCAVIPVGHLEHGLWAREHLDFARYNAVLLLGDLQWLAAK